MGGKLKFNDFLLLQNSENKKGENNILENPENTINDINNSKNDAEITNTVEKATDTVVNEIEADLAGIFQLKKNYFAHYFLVSQNWTPSKIYWSLYGSVLQTFNIL